MDTNACPRCHAPTDSDPDHRCAVDPTVRESAVPTLRVKPDAEPPATPPTPSTAGSPSKAVSKVRSRADASAALRKGSDAAPAELDRLARDPAKVVNQYVLVSMLGQGGMGQVWKAWDRKLSRWAALKFLTLNDPSSVKRFEREAKLAARLRHPNICAIYEVGQAQGRHFIAMEFVDGVPLGKANLSIRPAADVIAKISRALEEAHKEGVVHRDLKPDNLMITASGRPYVMDFGLAKTVEAESSLSVSGDIMGTPAYMSPEQARGDVDTIDGRTDVYSLGATLYTLLTGEKPFPGKTSMEIVMKVVNQEPTPPSRLKPGVPAALDAVVLKAMEKDRSRRYATAAQLGDDLERFLANQDVLARPPSPARRVLSRLKRHAVPVALGAILAGSLGIALMARGGAPAGTEGAEWLSTFRTERRALEYREWKAQDTASVAKVRELLGRLDDQPADSAREAADWLRKEIELAENALELWMSRPRSEWSKVKDQAGRALAWCDAARSVVQGRKGDFAALSGRLEELRRGAERLARWRGEFALRVAVVPFGEVQGLRRGGQAVPLKDRETPLVLSELEIGDYEIDLTAASQSPFHFSIPADRLRDGVTSTLIGDLRKPETVQIIP
jgi:predicted Ser/Thr protein kinase